jgi:hypothetical protein
LNYQTISQKDGNNCQLKKNLEKSAKQAKNNEQISVKNGFYFTQLTDE